MDKTGKEVNRSGFMKSMSPEWGAVLIEAGLQVSPPFILDSCNVADSCRGASFQPCFSFIRLCSLPSECDFGG